MKPRKTRKRNRKKSRKVPHHAPAKGSIEPTLAMKRYVGGPIRLDPPQSPRPRFHPGLPRSLSRTPNGYTIGATRRCRECGCSDRDCRQCIAKTGEPCFWVGADICSACAIPGLARERSGAA
ncbi:MAG: hypothetical protein KF873_02115 [Gemmataceae bacterium]|nr:hypothetical protein [Gemmataceae bacterium]